MSYTLVVSEQMFDLSRLERDGFADPLESEERDLEMMLKVGAAILRARSFSSTASSSAACGCLH